MGDDANPFDRLLNSSVPNAPQSEEEARERLQALDRLRQAAEEEQPQENADEETSDAGQETTGVNQETASAGQVTAGTGQETAGASPVTGAGAVEEPPSAKPAPGVQTGTPSAGRPASATARPASSGARPASVGAPPVKRVSGGLQDEVQEFDRLLKYAGELQKVLQSIDSATPPSSEGADRSGAVRVILGADGLPETFRVAADWNRRLKPEAVGGAFVEACEKATEKRLAAWGKLLEDQGLMEEMKKIDRLEAAVGVSSAGPAEGELPPAFRRKPEGFRPPLSALVENALGAQDALDSLLSATAAEPAREPTGSGSAKGRALRLTLTETGPVTCEVDGAWAARQSGVRLAEAANAALAAARRDLAAAAKAAESRSPGAALTRLSEMIMEASAVDFDPRRTR